jgi:hypothetical protein
MSDKRYLENVAHPNLHKMNKQKQLDELLAKEDEHYEELEREEEDVKNIDMIDSLMDEVLPNAEDQRTYYDWKDAFSEAVEELRETAPEAFEDVDEFLFKGVDTNAKGTPDQEDAKRVFAENLIDMVIHYGKTSEIDPGKAIRQGRKERFRRAHPNLDQIVGRVREAGDVHQRASALKAGRLSEEDLETYSTWVELTSIPSLKAHYEKEYVHAGRLDREEAGTKKTEPGEKKIGDLTLDEKRELIKSGKITTDDLNCS